MDIKDYCESVGKASIRFESGAYYRSVSISKRIATQATGKR
jgi:hypothetical protein